MKKKKESFKDIAHPVIYSAMEKLVDKRIKPHFSDGTNHTIPLFQEATMKLTKEDLDKFVVEMEQNDLAGLSFHKGTVMELLRLARLGMWAEEHAIEATQYGARADQSVASAYAEDALEALSKLPK